MSKLGLTCLMAVLATTGTGLAADAVRNSAIPMFATDDRTGWQLDRTFGVDDLIAPPEGGPGPVTFDKAHPYVPPGRPVPTYRVADLSNPILQDWVKPAMKKANDDVIAGGVAYRAHERCWPAGVPTFDTDIVGAPLFIYQRPNEIVVDHGVRAGGAPHLPECAAFGQSETVLVRRIGRPLRRRRHARHRYHWSTPTGPLSTITARRIPSSCT